MFTYAVYNFILFGATLSAYLYEMSDNKYIRIAFLFVSFIIPFIFLAIRYDIGMDYKSYVDYFNIIKEGIPTIKEPGYELVNQIVANNGWDVQWVFAFFGFTTFIFAYKALPKDGFAIGVFLLIAIFYLYEGYSAIRQGLAMAIMAYAIQYIHSKRFFIYLFWAIIAMLFHLMTGVVLLLVYFIADKHINKWILIGSVLVLFIGVKYTSLVENLVHWAILFMPKYSWYANSKYMEMATNNSGLGVVLKIFIFLVVVFYKDIIIKKYNQANVTINLYIIYIFGLIMHQKIIIFNRLEHMFIFYMIISIIFFIRTLDKASRIIVSIVMLIIYFLLFNKYISTAVIGEDDGNVINPYQTILRR